jgi:hypothetical protein
MTATETITVTADQLATLRRGDRVVRWNDNAMAHTVKAPYGPVYEGSKVNAVGLVNDSNGVAANLYADTLGDAVLTVERPRPRPAVRVVDGLRLVSAGDHTWVTADNRYVVRYGYGGVTECETDHPVKLTPALVKIANEMSNTTWAQPILDAVRNGQRGFICPAGSEHAYDCWQVWDNETDDYADGLSYAESFDDASRNLAALVARLHGSMA